MSEPGFPAGPLRRRIGFEIELLAPAGAGRETLARELAARCGGAVYPFFHVDSEPSLVPGMSHFLHLTRSYAVFDGAGEPVCSLADDITLRRDLDPRTPARPGWYRILCDEPRLLRLILRHVDPDAPLERVLDPVAELFGVPAVAVEGVIRIEDDEGRTVAMAAPETGERERACEIITPPWHEGHHERLAALLEPAARLGFTVPVEAAVHLHLDAEPLRAPHTLANLVRLFSAWREPLRAALGTNPNCTRLAPLPEALVELVAADPLPAWPELAAAAAGTGVTKYMDLNLTRLVVPDPGLDTVEVRILPGALDADSIVGRAALVEQLLDRCEQPEPLPEPASGESLSALLRTCARTG